MNRFLKIFLVALFAIPIVTGCVSSGSYDELQSQHNALQSDYEMLKQEVTLLTKQNTELSDQLQQSTQELERQRMQRQQMQQEFSELIEIGALTMKLLRDGLSIVLPQDILFTSGGTWISSSGKAVLRQVATKLNEVPYQVIVLGSTDNVPVGGKLNATYPSNWELAGARAAAVVRIFQEEGVEPHRMSAISLGENYPVATNDTAEGRAENRRIELRLRPVVRDGQVEPIKFQPM